MPDRDRPAAYSELISQARWAADNIGGREHPGVVAIHDIANAVEHLIGPETVRLIGPAGERVVIGLPIDVDVFAKVCAALAKGGFDFDRSDAPPSPRAHDAALKALVALLSDESVWHAATPEHLELARAAGWTAWKGEGDAPS